MLQELMAVTSTGLGLVNQAALVTSSALNVVGLGVKASENLVTALEKSTRVVDNEASILLDASEARLADMRKQVKLSSL